MENSGLILAKRGRTRLTTSHKSNYYVKDAESENPCKQRFHC